MEIELLGTGTSTGVPQIGCDCEVCCSKDIRDKRLRCSAIVRTRGVNLLIDCGPDFRQQMLRARDLSLDALLLTHGHYDHVGGIDDLRPYCMDRHFDVYGQARVLEDLKKRMPYCFSEHPYPGVPLFNLHPLSDDSPFEVKGVRVIPLMLMHYKLPVFGYRIGNMAYLTDVNHIAEQTFKLLSGIDVVFIDALRFDSHLSHFSLSEALEAIAKIQPKRAYLIHMSHRIGLHSETSRMLPANVRMAYDCQIVHVDD